MTATVTAPTIAVPADRGWRDRVRSGAPVVLALAAAAVGIAQRPELVLGFLGAAFLFIPLEQVLPLVRRAGWRRDAWVDVVHIFANRIPVTVGTGLVLAAVAPPLQAVTPEAIGDTVHAWPEPLQFVVAIVVVDLINYWSHRALHEIPLLWRLHAVHHSSEELDWLSTSRGHPIDQILTAAASSLPLYAVQMDVPLATTVLVLNFFLPFFLHANTRLTLRPLSAVFVTPAVHHWHHADTPEAVNRNYGAVLSIWDRLFGSLYLPGHMPPRYGTPTPVPRSWAGQMAFPFRRARAAAPAAVEPPAPRDEPWVLELPLHSGWTRLEVGRDAVLFDDGSTRSRLYRRPDPDDPTGTVVTGHVELGRAERRTRVLALAPTGSSVDRATGDLDAAPGTVVLRPLVVQVAPLPPPLPSPALAGLLRPAVTPGDSSPALRELHPALPR